MTTRYIIPYDNEKTRGSKLPALMWLIFISDNELCKFPLFAQPGGLLGVIF